MRIDIQATNLDLTDPLKEYIDKKVGSLDKFLKRFDESGVHARVEVARSSRHHRHGNVFYAEINLHFPGGMLRAKDESHDVRVALDNAKKKLQREIRKYKATH